MSMNNKVARSRSGVPVVLLALLLAGVAGIAIARPPLPALSGPREADALERAIHDLVNAERVSAGLAALTYDDVLADAAWHHAVEMVALGFFAHTSPTPERATPRHRVAAAGGATVQVGENLVSLSPMTPDFAQRAITAWMGSAAHRANILNDLWTHVGYGLHPHPDGRTFVVQVFATEPNPLDLVDVSASDGVSLRLTLDVEVLGAGVVAIGIDGVVGATTPGRAGETLRVVVDGVSATAPSQVLLGWGAAAGTLLQGQEQGVFDPGTGRLTISARAGSPQGRIVSHEVTPMPSHDAAVALTFLNDPAATVVLVNDARASLLVDAHVLRFRVPVGDSPTEVLVGRPLGGGRIDVVHGFVVMSGPEGPIVAALPP
jgi:uncharacterized protein YkwD